MMWLSVHSFRRDVLSSVPAGGQTSQMGLQWVFAFLSATQVSCIAMNDRLTFVVTSKLAVFPVVCSL